MVRLLSAEHRSAWLIVGLSAAFLIALSVSGWQLQVGRQSAVNTQLAVSLAAMCGAALMLVLGKSQFGSWTFAVLSVLLFATTPLLVRSVQGSSTALLQMPFVMAWLVSIDRWRLSTSPVWLGAAGGALACGLYSHPAALVVMPIYLTLTVAGLMSAGASHRSIAGLVVVFALVAAPWALLLREYPAYIHDHVTANRLYDAERFSVLQGIRDMSSWVGLTARSEVYWDYLNPAFLFFSRTGVFESLTSPKVFVTPLVVLIPVGLCHVATRSSSLAKWVLIGGLLTAPIPGALTAQPPIASRFTSAIPFAALLATHGLARLLRSWLPQRTRRTMVELG